MLNAVELHYAQDQAADFMLFPAWKPLSIQMQQFDGAIVDIFEAA